MGGSHYRWRPEDLHLRSGLFSFPGVSASSPLEYSCRCRLTCLPTDSLKYRRRDSTGEITPFLRFFLFSISFFFLFFPLSISLFLFCFFLLCITQKRHASGPRNWTMSRRKCLRRDLQKSMLNNHRAKLNDFNI